MKIKILFAIFIESFTNLQSVQAEVGNYFICLMPLIEVDSPFDFNASSFSWDNKILLEMTLFYAGAAGANNKSPLK